MAKVTCDLVRDAAAKLAETIYTNVPEGYERDMAIRRCREAMMWGVRGIIHNPIPDPPPICPYPG